MRTLLAFMVAAPISFGLMQVWREAKRVYRRH